MNIKPRNDRILIKLEESLQSFANGQLLLARVPDGQGFYKVEPQVGTVVAIGPDAKDVEVGDRVVCRKYAGVELSRREFGAHMRIMKEEFVMFALADATDLILGQSFHEHPTQEEFRKK